MKKIYLGTCDASHEISQSIASFGVERVFVVGDDIVIDTAVPVERITYAQSIEYRYYYSWLQSIGPTSLLVWNNAMRTVNRYDLHYNCIRKYMQQAGHRLIFERLPIRKSREDFMILWDMMQNNPYLREPYDEGSFSGIEIAMRDVSVSVEEVPVELTDEELDQYAAEKERIIAGVKKDTNVVPRRLLKFCEALATRHADGKFDSKRIIKPSMRVTVTQTGVDAYYMGEIASYIQELKHVLEKIPSEH